MLILVQLVMQKTADCHARGTFARALLWRVSGADQKSLLRATRLGVTCRPAFSKHAALVCWKHCWCHAVRRLVNWLTDAVSFRSQSKRAQSATTGLVSLHVGEKENNSLLFGRAPSRPSFMAACFSEPAFARYLHVLWLRTPTQPALLLAKQ
jgi:hypothetical protein